jgi:hypothetical protein
VIGPDLQVRARVVAARTVVSPWVFAAVAAAFVAVLTAASLRWPSNRFVASLETGSLGFVVARETTLPLGIEETSGEGIFVDQAQVVAGTVPPLQPLVVGATFSGRLIGQSIELALIRAGAGAEVTLLLDTSSSLQIRLRGNTTAEITLAGTARVEDAAGDGAESRFDPPEVITLEPRSGAAPLRLFLKATTKAFRFAFEGAYIRQLTLTHDRPADSADAPFRADVRSGKLRLVDVTLERELRGGEPLRFEHLNAYLDAASISGKSIRADLVGHAGSIVVGPPGFAEDVTPTVLEYIVGQEKLKLLWGVGGMLLAGLWGARRWARSVISDG